MHLLVKATHILSIRAWEVWKETDAGKESVRWLWVHKCLQPKLGNPSLTLEPMGQKPSSPKLSCEFHTCCSVVYVTHTYTQLDTVFKICFLYRNWMRKVLETEVMLDIPFRWRPQGRSLWRNHIWLENWTKGNPCDKGEDHSEKEWEAKVPQKEQVVC